MAIAGDGGADVVGRRLTGQQVAGGHLDDHVGVALGDDPLHVPAGVGGGDGIEAALFGAGSEKLARVEAVGVVDAPLAGGVDGDNAKVSAVLPGNVRAVVAQDRGQALAHVAESDEGKSISAHMGLFFLP